MVAQAQFIAKSIPFPAIRDPISRDPNQRPVRLDCVRHHPVTPNSGLLGTFPEVLYLPRLTPPLAVSVRVFRGLLRPNSPFRSRVSGRRFCASVFCDFTRWRNGADRRRGVREALQARRRRRSVRHLSGQPRSAAYRRSRDHRDLVPKFSALQKRIRKLSVTDHFNQVGARCAAPIRSATLSIEFAVRYAVSSPRALGKAIGST